MQSPQDHLFLRHCDGLGANASPTTELPAIASFRGANCLSRLACSWRTDRSSERFTPDSVATSGCGESVWCFHTITGKTGRQYRRRWL